MIKNLLFALSFILLLSSNLLASDSSWGDSVIKKTHVKRGFSHYNSPVSSKNTKVDTYDKSWFLSDKSAEELARIDAKKRRKKEKAAELRAEKKARKQNRKRSKMKKQKKVTSPDKKWDTLGWH